MQFRRQSSQRRALPTDLPFKTEGGQHLLSKQTQSLPLDRQSDLRTLAAACDMAVIRALELVGKRVTRDQRSRFGALNKSGKDWHEAHTIWRPEPPQVDAALAGAWSVLPRLLNDHGCCSLERPALHRVLDDYVRDLVFAQKPHTFEDLEKRLADAVEAVSR